MIQQPRNNLLTLHYNLQYYNTHKNHCFLDDNLNVQEMSENSNELKPNFVPTDLPQLILTKIRELYTGSSRDDRLLELIKKDIKLLNTFETLAEKLADLDEVTAKILQEIEILQHLHPKELQPIDWIKNKILNVIAIFDQDCDDSEGVIKDSTLHSGILSPDNIIIVPRTVLINSSMNRWYRHIISQRLCLFTQKNSNFLVIVPVSLMKFPSWEASLAALDLNPAELQPSNVQDLYTQNLAVKSEITQWKALWSCNCVLKKRWFLSGHGQSRNKNKLTKIVGLNDSHFMTLWSVIKEQPTEFAKLSTCHIGRTFPEQPSLFSNCPFPIVLGGRVDNPTLVENRDMSLFWMGVDSFIKNQNRPLSFALNRFINIFDKILPILPNKDRHYISQPLLLIPHSKGSPNGFRSVKGPDNVCTLTYNDVKAAQLYTQKPFQKPSHSGEITISLEKTETYSALRVSDRTKNLVVELYPLVLPITIRLMSDNVEIQSLIPGNAHHHIDKVILTNGEANNFFKMNSKGYKKSNSFKGLFFNHFETPSKLFRNVCLLFGEEKAKCCYHDPSSGKYFQLELTVLDHYLWEPNEINKNEISKFEALLSILESFLLTIPNSSSLILSSGGQIAIEESLKAIQEGFEWKEFDNKILTDFFTYFSKMAFESVNPTQLEEFSLLPKEFQSILIQLATLYANQILPYCESNHINNENWKSFVSIVREDKTAITKEVSLKIAPSFEHYKSTLTQETINLHPNILEEIIEKMQGNPIKNSLKKSFKLYREELAFLEFLENTFELTDKQQNQINKKRFQHFASCGQTGDMKNMEAWIQSLPENERRDLLQGVLECTWQKDAVLEVLISLGLNPCDEFLKTLISSALKPPFRNLIIYFKEALDKIEPWFWEYNINIDFDNPEIFYILEYLLRENKMKIRMANSFFTTTLNHLVRKILNPLVFDASGKKAEQEVEHLIELAEWFAQKGTPFFKKDMNAKFSKLIPRLISESCGPHLIFSLLCLINQSEEKELFDDIFLIASIKGRWDVLSYLDKQGCRYNSGIIQLGKFYARQKGITDLTLLDRLRETSISP